MCYAATSHMRRVVFLVNSQTTYVHIHCKIQTGLENIFFFSHSLALRIFQPRGPAGLAEGAGLTSSIYIHSSF